MTDPLYARVVELWPFVIRASWAVWGLGRRRTPRGDVLVVAVDARVDPRLTGEVEQSYSGARRPLDRSIELLRRTVLRDASGASHRLPWDLVSSVLRTAGWSSPLRELDGLLPPSEGVELIFLPPPRPVAAFRIGPESSGPHALGTVGPRLVCDERGPLVLTAGHVFPGLYPGQQAEARIFGPGLMRLREIGSARVEYVTESVGPEPGFDYALAASSVSALHVAAVDRTVGPPHVPTERQCTIRRGKGASRPGFVTDTVLDLVRGRDVAGTSWARCWLVTGRGGFAAEEGDSGSAVVLDDGALLGHLVAVTGWPFGRPEMGLVQDAWSVLQHAHYAFCPCLRFC